MIDRRRNGLNVLVCGGRDFADESAIVNYLFRFDDERPIAKIIQGGATGADAHAKRAANLMKIPCLEYKANWKKYGKRAGPLRNQRMLDDTNPHVVIAFAGGRGTADMIARAREARIEIIEVKP